MELNILMKLPQLSALITTTITGTTIMWHRRALLVS